MADAVVVAGPTGGTPDANRLRGVVMVIAGSALFAANGVVSKSILLAGVPALQLTQLRSLGAFVGIIGFLAVFRPRQLRLTRRELPVLLLYGVIGYAGVQLFYFVAIRELPVGIGLLLEYTAPILVALWVRFGLRQPVRKQFWAALVLALFGLSLVAQVWQQGVGLDRLGVIAGFAAAGSLATYFIVSERVTRPGGRDAASLTGYAFGAATLFLAIVSPWTRFPFEILTETTEFGSFDAVPVWALAAWMIVLGTIAPFLLVVMSLRYLSASGTSALGMLEPVLAFLMAWIVLGETLAVGQVIGAAVVLCGVYLAEMSRVVSRPT